MKIYISPSSQTANTYAVGDTNEAEQCRSIARMLQTALQRCGFEARTNVEEGKTMFDRVAESNEWAADLHIPIHTNAFNGQLQGTRLFCYKDQAAGWRACSAILEELGSLVPGTSDSIREARYYELTATKAPCAYVEAAFHDHPQQAQWIIDHKEELAEAICRGICSYYGTAYQPPRASALYRVQVGAFRRWENARDLVAALEKAGFQGAFIRTQEEEP